MGSTLLIPLGLGFVIKVDGLPCLPSIDHREVLRGFSVRCFPWKKKAANKGQVCNGEDKIENVVKELGHGLIARNKRFTKDDAIQKGRGW
jgi:hypothetical protein